MMVMETTGSYAFLLTSGDGEDSSNQDKYGRYMMTGSAAEAKISFYIPEIQSIAEKTLKEWVERPDFSDYKIFLTKLLRMKPYILSEKEERLLSLEGESGTTAHKTFSTLTNVDLDFGSIRTKEGLKKLTQSSWSSFMQSEDRDIRKKAYTKFYKAFDAHKNTIATLYAGSVNHDIYEARARGYESARAMALYPDNVPESVYDNLVKTVRANLEPLHRYYAIRKDLLGLKELRHYDVYVPLVKDIKKVTPYNDAVEIIRNALAPLGEDYTNTLCDGLLNGWADRYENKGNVDKSIVVKVPPQAFPTFFKAICIFLASGIKDCRIIKNNWHIIQIHGILKPFPRARIQIVSDPINYKGFRKFIRTLRCRYKIIKDFPMLVAIRGMPFNSDQKRNIVFIVFFNLIDYPFCKWMHFSSNVIRAEGCILRCMRHDSLIRATAVVLRFYNNREYAGRKVSKIV